VLTSLQSVGYLSDQECHRLASDLALVRYQPAQNIASLLSSAFQAVMATY